MVVLRAGAQVQEFSGGVSNTSPYVEATLRAALSPAAQVRAFVRYGLEDRNRLTWTHDCWEVPVLGRFEERQTFRLGLQGSYVMSPKLTFFGGVNIMSFSYEGQFGPDPAAPDSMDDKIININGGASYEVADNIFITGSYNYTKSR